MSTKVLLKKSSVQGKIPLATDLTYGELALNYADGKLYFKDTSNNVQSFSSNANLSIDDLSDVDTSTNTPNTNEVLKWNGSNWVPGTVSTGAGGLTTNSISEDTQTIATTSTNYTIDSFSATEYRTVKYLIQAISDGEVYSSEVLLTHDDNQAFISESTPLTTPNGGELVSLSATIDTGNVLLRATTITSNTIIDFVKTSIIARTVGWNYEGDLQLLSGSIDLQSISGTAVDLN